MVPTGVAMVALADLVDDRFTWTDADMLMVEHGAIGVAHNRLPGVPSTSLSGMPLPSTPEWTDPAVDRPVGCKARQPALRHPDPQSEWHDHLIRPVGKGGPEQAVMGIEPRTGLIGVQDRVERPGGRLSGEAQARKIKRHAARRFGWIATRRTANGRRAKCHFVRSSGWSCR